jgi:hypothetical protein
MLLASIGGARRITTIDESITMKEGLLYRETDVGRDGGANMRLADLLSSSDSLMWADDGVNFRTKSTRFMPRGAISFSTFVRSCNILAVILK